VFLDLEDNGTHLINKRNIIGIELEQFGEVELEKFNKGYRWKFHMVEAGRDPKIWKSKGFDGRVEAIAWLRTKNLSYK